MITHTSAIKRHRQSLKKRARNIETKSKLRTLIKRVRRTIQSDNRNDLKSQMSAVNKALGKAVSKGIVKSNTASRWLARLARAATRPTA